MRATGDEPKATAKSHFGRHRAGGSTHSSAPRSGSVRRSAARSPSTRRPPFFRRTNEVRGMGGSLPAHRFFPHGEDLPCGNHRGKRLGPDHGCPAGDGREISAATSFARREGHPGRAVQASGAGLRFSPARVQAAGRRTERGLGPLSASAIGRTPPSCIFAPLGFGFRGLWGAVGVFEVGLEQMGVWAHHRILR
jgi:hypothetical protein